MPAVICLDDSSDEEEVASVPAVAARGQVPVEAPPATSSSVSKPGQNQNKSNEVVELLDDSDDDDAGEGFHIATAGPKRNENQWEDDYYLKDQIERAKRTSLATLNSDSVKKATKANTGNRVSLGQSPLMNLNSDSDSDDDAILNFQPVSFGKNKTSNKCKSDRQDSTINLSQSSSATASSEASNKTACTNKHGNSHDKKTPAKTASRTSAASTSSATPSAERLVSNPYAASRTENAPKATPCAVSSRKTVVNPYSSLQKKKAPPAAIDTTGRNVARFDGNQASLPNAGFPYPILSEKYKKYEDLRARYLLAFWSSARGLTLNSYNRPKLDNTAKRIVALALWPYPLRSMHEFCHRPKKAKTSIQQDEAQRKELEAQLESGGFHGIRVPVGASESGRFCSIAEACLVAMATEVDKRRRQSPEAAQKTLNQHLASKDSWISLHFLIPEIDKRLLPYCPARMFRAKDQDGGVAYYTDPATKSAEYRQIEKLQLMCPTHRLDVDKDKNNGSEGYIKQRKYKKQVLFELTPLGYETAGWITGRVFPAPSGHYRTSHIASLDDVKPEYRDICLGMDFREGGAKKHVIHSMANKLDWKKVPYFIGTMDVGDYIFFWTSPGPDQGKLCPIMVERKSIQDLAQSIADGRWVSQKQRMYRAQYVLGYATARIAYIIEGNLDKQMVSGNYVGHSKFNVDRQKIEEAIEGLESEGFDVLRTTTPENSMFTLTRWCTRVAEEVRTGKLEIKYTFQEFKDEVSLIPRSTDFSRLAKDNMERRRERENQATATATQSSDDIGAGHGGIEDHSSKKGKKDSSSIKPSTCESIDLCSDDDDNNDHSNCAQNPEKHRLDCKPSKSMPRAKLNGASLPNATTPTSRFRTPPEVKAYFNAHDSDDDSDDDLAEARKTLRYHNRKKEKQRKRKLEDQVEQHHKRQKMAATCRGDKPSASTKRRKKAGSSDRGNQPNSSGEIDVEEKQPIGEYESWSASQLKEKCEEVGLAKTGKKADLVTRLRGPKPPQVWLERKKKGKYVPERHNTGATALLVALYLHESNVGPDEVGMTKEELYSKAEELQISKHPFSGGTTQTGPFHYDGWSSMSKLLKGDPALVIQTKHTRYKLTRSCDLAGFNVAKALHQWCHEHDGCVCGR